MAAANSDRTAAIAATAASAAMVAFQLAGKATRDALFLSTFGVRALPRMVILAAVCSAVVAILLSKVLIRVGPGRLVPRLFGLSALLLLVEWGLAGSARTVVAAVFYIHFSCLGALLVSGFWGMITERFDPRTARATIGRIAAGGSVGGLLGGLLPAKVGGSLPVTAMLPLLAALHLLSAVLVFQVRPQSSSRGGIPLIDKSTPKSQSAGQIFRSSPYLRGLVLLVALSATAEGLLDYIFKARATASEPSAGQLLQLFAAFYTGTALLTILVQTTVLKRVLARLGIARSAALLPAGVSVGALGGMFFLGVPAMILARGTEIVLRNSIFRAAYELLFGPVPPREKRATKLLVDVGAARLGDVLAGGLIQITLLLSLGTTGPVLLGATILVAVGALAVARQLHMGYVGALERSLTLRAGHLPPSGAEDMGALLQSVGGFDLSQLQSSAPSRPSLEIPRPPVETVTLGPASENQRARDLESDNPSTVRAALEEESLKPELVELAIPLLAWDAVAPDAIRALGAVSQRVTGQLIRHLLDPEEDFAIRRRLVPVLAECPTPEAFDGLLGALNDQRFEVRYRAGRALHKLRREIPALVLDRDRILQAVLNEVAVGRGVWESRELLDSTDDVWGPMEVDFVRHRANRSLEHVFTLLALVLPAEPLRLAYHGLHTDDRNLRGTALEYLESVLPDQVREKLWPFLEPQGRRDGVRGRTPDQVLENLLASRESIVLALAEIRKRSSTPEPRPKLGEGG
ncbi:MAG: hypothetical protein ABJC74_05430 [Gemmatimonadota bacterium]